MCIFHKYKLIKTEPYRDISYTELGEEGWKMTKTYYVCVKCQQKTKIKCIWGWWILEDNKLIPKL